MENNANQFDKLFKDKLDGVEVDYNPGHWEEMSSIIDKAAPASGGSSAGNGWSLGKTAAVIGGSIAVLTAGYFLMNDSSSQSQAVNQETSIEVSEANPQKINTSDRTNVENAPSNDIAEEVAAQPNDSSVDLKSSAASETPVEERPVNLEEKINKISSNNSQQNKMESQRYIEEKDLEMIPEDPAPVNFENKKLKTDFSADATEICVGNKVQFNTNRDIDKASYFWDFGDGGLTSREQNPEHVFNRPGTFTVTLIVSKGEKNDYQSRKEQYIEVKAAPSFNISWDDSELTLYDPYSEFEVETAPSDLSYSWKIEDKKYTSSKVEHKFKAEGRYLVEVTAKNAQCTVTKVKEVEIDKTSALPLENTLTLNGDGLNEEFPVVLSSINVPFEMKILDHTGRQLYSTRDSSQPWNGRYNNSGEYVPEGNYKCIIITKDKYNNENLQVAVIKIMH